MPQRTVHRVIKRRADASVIGEKESTVWERDRTEIRAACPDYRPETRNRAGALIRSTKEETDPDRPAQSMEPTVAELAQRYMELHATVSCKAQTIESYRMIIDTQIVPALGKLRIGSVQRADVAALHHALRDRPGMANRAVQILGQMYRKAGQWDLIAEGRNPCRGIRKYPLASAQPLSHEGRIPAARAGAQTDRGGQIDLRIGGGGVASPDSDGLPAQRDSYVAMGRCRFQCAGAETARQQDGTLPGRVNLGGGNCSQRHRPCTGQSLGDRQSSARSASNVVATSVEHSQSACGA